ncbi:MAG: heparinase II/III family protein, partial [Chthoniobacterales bacterium]
VSLVIDLAPEIFTKNEREELADTLREKAMPLCLRWLDGEIKMANWRCVLTAGLALSAAVLDDAESLCRAEREFRLCQNVFQPDGSYAEGLQYGNYAAYAQMLTWESLTRRLPALTQTLPITPYALMPRWQAASLFYRKTLSGWGSQPRPRSANFNDSAAIFRPSGDLLLHIAARGGEDFPQAASLARWLFDQLYTPVTEQEPHNRASFGFVNDFGFLSLALITKSAAPMSPNELSLGPVCAFSCGDVLVRDSWAAGRTTLAIHGGGDPLHAPGHLHGDLNSFILTHNQERLFVDPGHSCYRNLIHVLEGATTTHNTCTFSRDGGDLQQEERLKTIQVEQQTNLQRVFDPATGEPASPVERGGQRLLAESIDGASAVVSEVSALYGDSVREFTRCWLLCGSHVLFVIDRIVTAVPMKTTWNWLLNNRDSELKLKLHSPDHLMARRAAAGIKIYHLGDACLSGPFYGYVHDAYHPQPNQLGEGQLGSGQPGSGRLVRWTEKRAAVERTIIHAIAVDDAARIADWQLRSGANSIALESPAGKEVWELKSDEANKHFSLCEAVTSRRFRLTPEKIFWKFTKA